jgi:hypothetical protein
MIERLRELLARATPGPWKSQDHQHQADLMTWYSVEKANGMRGQVARVMSHVRGKADAALIVAAVNALPALLDVCEAAQAFRVSGVPHHAWVRLWNALDALAALARVQP